MTGSRPDPVLVVGVGPGLGLSIARRFGREGRPVALISRSPQRHEAYLAALRQDGIDGIAVTADVRDGARMSAALDEVTTRLGPVGVVYYGPGAADPGARPEPLLQTRAAHLREAMAYYVEPALDLVQLVLPQMTERGSGALLFATGLGAVVPLPALGALAVATAALRNYALTLNVALEPTGVYAGALVLGGLIRGGDIHRVVIDSVAPGPEVPFPVLDPGSIADVAWTLAQERDRPEAVFDALTGRPGGPVS
jgi:NAD(P)-dependent dehydrogenase (short-subunit alcohol dehydrogenase family)